MNDFPTVSVPTKYGELVVSFQGERTFEEHSFEGKKRLTAQGAWVRTLDGAPLTINGVEYQVYAHPVLCSHWSRDAVVTDWHYIPGEYAVAHRKGMLGAFIGEPTDKARSLVRELCTQVAEIAVGLNPGILTLAESVRLDLEAERSEAEAHEAACKARKLTNEVFLMRVKAQELRVAAEKERDQAVAS